MIAKQVYQFYPSWWKEAIYICIKHLKHTSRDAFYFIAAPNV